MRIRSLVLIAVAATAATAFADEIPLAKAKVLSVTPYLEREQVPKTVQRCQQVQEVTHHKDTLAPSIFGALVGAAIGHQIGHGSGRDFATVAGATAGLAIGNKNAPSTQHVVVKQECDPVVEYDTVETKKYRVVYELGGQQFVTSMDEQPGTTIDVRLAPT